MCFNITLKALTLQLKLQLFILNFFENCGLHICEAFVTNADVTNNVCFFAVSGLVWGMGSLYFPFVYMKLESSG